eukprot:6098732-Pyramimonas_sp.AAC.1
MPPLVSTAEDLQGLPPESQMALKMAPNRQVIKQDADGLSHAGRHAARAMRTCRSAPNDQLSSADSEYTALLWVTIYMSDADSGCMITVESDSLNAVRGSNGFATPPKTDPIGRLTVAWWRTLEE